LRLAVNSMLAESCRHHCYELSALLLHLHARRRACSPVCRAQFVKWAQTLEPGGQERWERLRTVRCFSCSWDPPILGWPAREAAVTAYCDALQGAAKRQPTTAGTAPATAAPSRPRDGLSNSQSPGRQPRPAAAAAAGMSASPSGGRGPLHGHAVQEAMHRDARQAERTTAGSARSVGRSQHGDVLDGLAADPAASGAKQERTSAGPGFAGLSLCLYKRMPKGETIFRR